MTKSKSIEDILFKALVCEIVDHFACAQSESLAHSVDMARLV
jgi:hypothetical protein